uniref:Tyrosine-protein kinase n=1 Tax=Ascaris lumbricoides TaxID=6252 RepID=A0A0M3HTN0_ASCLU
MERRSKTAFRKVSGFVGEVSTLGSKAYKHLIPPIPAASSLKWRHSEKSKCRLDKSGLNNKLDNSHERGTDRERSKPLTKESETGSSGGDLSTNKGSEGNNKDSKKLEDENEEKKAAEIALYDKEKAALMHEDWYHGLMPRDEIEEMLKRDGDFLVRKTEVARKTRFAISVFFNGRIRHLLVNCSHGMWAIRNVRKRSLAQLIEYYLSSRQPVQNEGTFLLNGIKRPPYYILHDHIIIGKKLGGGAFGDVHLGVWKKSDKEEVNEASIMRKFHHPNIVGVLGVAAQEQPLMILMDLAPNGALNSYLKKHPETDSDRLIRFVTDAARGMCYLSASKVIHRDVAARNCLLGVQYEVKISDFGLSVSNTENIKVDRLKNVPVRWLSPETLRLSDVWSFGVLIWEVFSHCKTDPFPGLSNAQARAASGKEPMQPPDGTPSVACQVMHLCFMQNPKERADFETVLRLLSPSEEPPTTTTYLPPQVSIDTLRKSDKKSQFVTPRMVKTPKQVAERPPLNAHVPSANETIKNRKVSPLVNSTSSSSPLSGHTRSADETQRDKMASPMANLLPNPISSTPLKARSLPVGEMIRNKATLQTADSNSPVPRVHSSSSEKAGQNKPTSSMENATSSALEYAAGRNAALSSLDETTAETPSREQVKQPVGVVPSEDAEVDVDEAPEAKTKITTDATSSGGGSPAHLSDKTFYESTNTDEDDGATATTDCSRAIPELKKTTRGASPATPDAAPTALVPKIAPTSSAARTHVIQRSSAHVIEREGQSDSA